MLNRIIYTLGISILLNGCDSGSENSKDSQTLRTGTFVDSPVKGLSYQTESQSGLTNDKGEFLYREGEQITFSIGAIALGTAQANSVITPFSLVGSAPLDNEQSIVSTLNKDDVTSFDRAINIATLLQAIDTDGDPNNGINLGTANTALETSSVNLFTKSKVFQAQQDFKDLLGLLNIEPDRSFVDAAQHLYDSLDLRIHSNLVETMVSFENQSKKRSISYSYSEEQLLIEKSTDLDSNGVVDQHEFYDYDSQNRLVRTTDTILDIIETINYDDQGNILTKEQDYPNDTQDLLQTYSYEQSQISKLETDYGNDGSVDSTTSYDYDNNGALVQHTVTLGSNTAPSSITIHTYSANKLKTTTEDTNGDGQANLEINYSYDSNGNVMSKASTRVSDGKAVTTISRFKYNAQNLPIRYEMDSNQDGQAEYIEEYRYTNQGKLQEHKKDPNADGKWDSITHYKYDANGNRTQMIEDSDGNGIVDKIWQADYQAATFDNPWETIRKQL